MALNMKKKEKKEENKDEKEDEEKDEKNDERVLNAIQTGFREVRDCKKLR